MICKQREIERRRRVIYMQMERKRGSFKIGDGGGEIEKREEIFGMRSKIGKTESGREERGE